MKYAIVEKGGKQYKVVEGETIEVDRLPVNAGDKFEFERVLMLVDGDDISVGTPTVKGIQVKTTVVGHFKGPKIIVFKYRPRKRYRVKSGHRQQFTRLMIDAIGKAGAAAKAKNAEAPKAKADEKKVVKKEATAKKAVKAAAKKAPAKKIAAKKAPAKKAPAKKTAAKKTPEKKTEKAPAKKTAAKKASAKKTAAKKTTAKKSTTKKTSSTKKSEK